MKIYDDKHIKNVAFVGAHDCGKTTLAETMLFEAGLLNRRGTVEDKNTVSDFKKLSRFDRQPFMQHPYTLNGGIIRSISLTHPVWTTLSAK